MDINEKGAVFQDITQITKYLRALDQRPKNIFPRYAAENAA